MYAEMDIAFQKSITMHILYRIYLCPKCQSEMQTSTRAHTYHAYPLGVYFLRSCKLIRRLSHLHKPDDIVQTLEEII